MAEKLIGKCQKFYLSLEKLGKVKEAVCVWLLFMLLVYGVIIGTGTWTSGFHLVDDWQMAKYVDLMDNEGISVWECMRQEVVQDFRLRFRPLYYIYRVLAAAVFGINLQAVSVLVAFEIVVAAVFLYYCARLMNCNIVYSLLFAATNIVGYQSAVWWKLGPQESYGIMVFAIGFWCVLKWQQTSKRRYGIASLIAFLVISVYKESFVLMLPFAGFYLLYRDMEGQKITVANLWNAIKKRLPYYLALLLIFFTVIGLIVFWVGANNVSYVGLDSGQTYQDYKQTWTAVTHGDLKWYMRFCTLMSLILLTYWEKTKKLGWEIFLAVMVVLPQVVTYSKPGIAERYIIPAVFGVAFFFIIVGCNFKPLSGKRRIAYVLCLCLMLAAHARAALIEANYFVYRGNSIKTMLETTLELVEEDGDKKVLSCFAPNAEGNLTMYYWFRVHGFTEMYNWYEEDQMIGKSSGSGYAGKSTLDEMDIVVMYNREDRHWCYEPTLDLSDFQEIKCGTITMYTRKEDETGTAKQTIGARVYCDGELEKGL